MLRGLGAKVVSVQKGAQADEGVLLRVGLRLDAVLWSRAPLVSVRVSVGLGWEAVVRGCGRLRIHVQKEHRRQQRHVAGRCGAASARVGVDGDEELVQRGLHG